MSRAVDEAGNVQPTLEQFKASRPPGNDYRNNAIRAWRVAPDGQVTFATGL
jgi:sulfane dehydrogenase subunit SoxC